MLQRLGRREHGLSRSRLKTGGRRLRTVPADFRRQEKTYYLPDGDSHVEALSTSSRPIAPMFSSDGIVAALRAIQAGQISYVEFLGRIVEAGCVGYFVYIAGRRAIYLGRAGDMHVEHFPPVAAVSGT